MCEHAEQILHFSDGPGKNAEAGTDRHKKGKFRLCSLYCNSKQHARRAKRSDPKYIHMIPSVFSPCS